MWKEDILNTVNVYKNSKDYEKRKIKIDKNKNCRQTM